MGKLRLFFKSFNENKRWQLLYKLSKFFLNYKVLKFSMLQKSDIYIILCGMFATNFKKLFANQLKKYGNKKN